MIYPGNRLSPAAGLGWVLVANGARARSFVRDAENDAMREIRSFVNPELRMKGQELGEERGGMVFKGAASTQFAPHTPLHDKLQVEFARELASYLEEGALAHLYPGLSIIAGKAFLGDLRHHLGPATRRLLRASVALDLTLAQGAELERQVARALQDASETQA